MTTHKIDFRSDEWEAIKVYLEDRLEKTRAVYEGPYKGKATALITLGKIQTYKEILRLPEIEKTRKLTQR